MSPHASAAVTGTSGEARFEAPAGEHVVETWHETLGVTRRNVRVEAGKVTAVEIEMKRAD